MSALERLKKINARPLPEESVPLRVAVLVAVETAALATLAQGVGGAGLRLAVVAGIPLAFWFSWWARAQGGFWLKVGLATAVLVAFGHFLGSLTGLGQGDFSVLQIPLAELFLWMQLLHALDVPARRDLLFSLVSSLVLMAVAGVLSSSMSYGLYLIVWGVAAAAGLVLAHRSSLGELPALRPVTPPTGEPGRPALGARRGVRSALSVIVVVAAVTGVATGVFLVAPPAGTSRGVTFPAHLPRLIPIPEVGGLANPSLGDGDPARPESRRGGAGKGKASFGYSGFSATLDTSLRGRPDKTLVMRVRASRPDFWRGQSFDHWDGAVWTASDVRETPVAGLGSIELPPAAGDSDGWRNGPSVVQTFFIAKPGPNLVFAAANPSKLYIADRRVFVMADGTVRTGVQLEAGAVYTVVSSRPAVTAESLRGDPVPLPPPDVMAQYRQLPEVSDRVRDLARAVTAKAPTEYDKVLALEEWMSLHTQYTLDIPPLRDGADSVDTFLFVDRKGFCEQIGTSLVVMLRSLGIPARLAVGFVPGERNPFTGLYEVRAENAHAWAEVWFPSVGWQSFDPTASVPLAGEGGVHRASSGLLSYLGAHLPQPPVWMLLGAGLVAALVAAVALAIRLRSWMATWASRRERSWADACLARLEGAGAGKGRPRRSSETTREYASALRHTTLADPRLDEVALIVTRAAFGARPVTDDEQELVERVLADVAQSRR